MLFVKILKGEDYEITHSGRLKMFVKNHERLALYKCVLVFSCFVFNFILIFLLQNLQ